METVTKNIHVSKALTEETIIRGVDVISPPHETGEAAHSLGIYRT